MLNDPEVSKDSIPVVLRKKVRSKVTSVKFSVATLALLAFLYYGYSIMNRQGVWELNIVGIAILPFMVIGVWSALNELTKITDEIIDKLPSDR